MRKLKIGVPIASAQKGLLVSFGKELMKRGHQVFYIARDNNVKKVIQDLMPDKSEEHIDVKSSFSLPRDADIIEECLRKEEKYGEFFSMLTSYHRALGKGYLYNSDNHPDIIKAWWSKEKKFEEILSDFYYYEYVIKKYIPNLILGFGHIKILSLICRHRNIPYITITAPRFGKRYYWVDNEYEQNFKLFSLVRKYVKELSLNGEFSDIELSQTEYAKYFFAKINYSYFNSIKEACHSVFVQTHQRIRGVHKRNSYRFMGWVKPLLQRPYIYKYFLHKGKKLKDLKGSKIVLFPLHVEPESSLMHLSPELNSSIEIIVWISKCLPADTYLVVKEHPYGFGIRSRKYWDNLRRMCNVVLAHPSVSSLEWLKACDLVASITGTMGFEAIFIDKPVISFGKYQIINELPTVRYANSFDSTKKAVNELLRLQNKDIRFRVSKEALNKAQEQISFDLSGFERIYQSTEYHMDMAEVAIDSLHNAYPEIFT